MAKNINSSINKYYFMVLILNSILIAYCEYNLTEWRAYRRQKRTLVYANAGIAKIVAGVICPVNLFDKTPWRQMNLALNVQAQYQLPQTPIYPWNKFGTGRSLEEAKNQYDSTGMFPEDQSQKVVFKMIELYMNNAGKNGRKCLERAICENAEIDEVEGIYSEILKVVLTPNEGCYDSDYINAYKAGQAGALCSDLYPECPLGNGLFDTMSLVQTRGLLDFS